MRSDTATVKPIKTKKFPKQRHFLAVFFISFMWGMFGVDRMYLGKWGTGILKLITLGGFGLWVVIDIFLIMHGSMRDKWNREMLQAVEYKAFAYKTVFIFAVILGLVVLINGIIIILGITQLFTSLQDGTLPQIPGIDALEGLQGLQPGGISPEQRQELGI